jgi:hypothetical protein
VSIRSLLRDVLDLLGEIRLSQKNDRAETSHRIDTLRCDVMRKPPIDVHLTDAQVAQVTERVNDPFIVTSDIAEIFARIAAHGPFVTQTHAAYYDGYALRADWTFRPDGTAQLDLEDQRGARAWTGVFHGPTATQAITELAEENDRLQDALDRERGR